MKALSIRAPWWWFILHGGKDIENRSWPTNFRGTIAVHASQWWQGAEAMEHIGIAREICLRQGVSVPAISIDAMRRMGGHLVGTVDIVDCVVQSSSPWFFGEYGFVLANPVVFADPIPCRGALSFFEIQADTPQLRHQGGEGQQSLFAAVEDSAPQKEGE